MKELIASLIKDALEKQKVKISKEEILKFVEIPPSIELGDFAFPCFFLSEK
jgi:arginyl-tRNA synthetase